MTDASDLLRIADALRCAYEIGDRLPNQSRMNHGFSREDKDLMEQAVRHLAGATNARAQCSPVTTGPVETLDKARLDAAYQAYWDNSSGTYTSIEAAILSYINAPRSGGVVQTRQEPVEWHWRVLEDNGHPASKWFVVDGDVEEFKRDMASDPYEIRPLYTAPAQWMQVPKPWAYYVEHKMFGVELSLDQPSEDAERRGWVGKRTAGVTPGPSEDLLCEMCSESVEGAHHPECMYHVDQARTFVPAQGSTDCDAPDLEAISRAMCDADLWVGAWDEQKAALIAEGRDWQTDARMVRYSRVAPAVAALYAGPSVSSTEEKTHG